MQYGDSANTIIDASSLQRLSGFAFFVQQQQTNNHSIAITKQNEWLSWEERGPPQNH